MPARGSPPGLDKAIAAKRKHADRLLDQPGVAGVGVALNRAGKPVIEIYKEKADVPTCPSPRRGRGRHRDDRRHRAAAPTDRFPRPVPIGVSAGLSGIATGTLGVRVTDGTNVYVLSNNHVLAGVNTASIGDPIIQPGDADGGHDPADRIATLAAYQTINFSGGSNTMDAAIALTSTANVGHRDARRRLRHPELGNRSGVHSGSRFRSTAARPASRLGDVVGTNVSVDVCYLLLFNTCFQEARFDGQFSISPGPFSAPGDSGSLVVSQGGNPPVGLLFAGGDGLTIATPIDVVLQRFGVTIDGQPPGDGPPSAPTALRRDRWRGVRVGVVERARLRRRLAGHQLQGLPRYERGVGGLPRERGHRDDYVDGSVTNGTTYYYKVSAENANGEGALSAGASATPTDLVVPEALVTVDDFNRANETLSDSGAGRTGQMGRSRRD